MPDEVRGDLGKEIRVAQYVDLDRDAGLVFELRSEIRHHRGELVVLRCEIEHHSVIWLVGGKSRREVDGRQRRDDEGRQDGLPFHRDLPWHAYLRPERSYIMKGGAQSPIAVQRHRRASGRGGRSIMPTAAKHQTWDQAGSARELDR